MAFKYQRKVLWKIFYKIEDSAWNGKSKFFANCLGNVNKHANHICLVSFQLIIYHLSLLFDLNCEKKESENYDT